jgi:hypothetical protein
MGQSKAPFLDGIILRCFSDGEMVAAGQRNSIISESVNLTKLQYSSTIVVVTYLVYMICLKKFTIYNPPQIGNICNKLILSKKRKGDGTGQCCPT